MQHPAQHIDRSELNHPTSPMTRYLSQLTCAGCQFQKSGLCGGMPLNLLEPGMSRICLPCRWPRAPCLRFLARAPRPRISPQRCPLDPLKELLATQTGSSRERHAECPSPGQRVVNEARATRCGGADVSQGWVTAGPAYPRASEPVRKRNTRTRKLV